MINTCKTCGCPTIRGECPECPPVHGWTFVALCLLAVVFYAAKCSGVVHGQDRGSDDLDAGRCLVAETDSRQPDLDATAHVILRRAAAHRRTASAEARSYCAMYVSRQRSDRQADIAATMPTDSTARGGQLRVALKALREARAGTRVDPCTLHTSSVPTDWGDRGEDARRARAAGWLPVDCGETRDLFWIATRRADVARGRHR